MALDKKVTGFRVEAVVVIAFEMIDERTKQPVSGYYYRLCIAECNDAGQTIGCKLLKCTQDFAEYLDSLDAEIISQQIAFDQSGRACALY